MWAFLLLENIFIVLVSMSPALKNKEEIKKSWRENSIVIDKNMRFINFPKYIILRD